MDTLTIDKHTKLSTIQSWVKAMPEKSGSVKVNSKQLVFHNNGRVMVKNSFHTHPKLACNGGYQPPSVHDLGTVLNGAIAGKVERHYVLAAQGLYIINVKCGISTKASDNILKVARNLRSTMQPSSKHHQKWMMLINQVHPRCFHVEYCTWSQQLHHLN